METVDQPVFDCHTIFIDARRVGRAPRRAEQLAIVFIDRDGVRPTVFDSSKNPMDRPEVPMDPAQVARGMMEKELEKIKINKKRVSTRQRAGSFAPQR